VESIVIVALGASLGREAAPQQTGAALASALSVRAKLPEWQRRLLVACGAGAGMAAVYNVPLGGALFTLEVLMGTVTLPLVLPALATTLTATAVAWIAIPHVPTYAIPPDRLRERTAPDELAHARSRAGRRVRRPRRGRVAVPPAARQRQERRADGVRRPARCGTAGGAARAQADRHGGLPWLGRAGGAVHADAHLRRAARRPGRSCGPVRRLAPTRSSAALPCSRPRCRRRWPRPCCCSS